MYKFFQNSGYRAVVDFGLVASHHYLDFITLFNTSQQYSPDLTFSAFVPVSYGTRKHEGQ